MQAVQVPMPWTNYVLMGVWVTFGVSIILASSALLRRIAFRMGASASLMKIKPPVEFETRNLPWIGVAIIAVYVFIETLKGNPIFLNLVNGLSELMILVILIHTYRRTREVAVVWLGVVMIVWPVISLLLQTGEHAIIDRMVRDRLTHHQIPIFMWGYATEGTVTVGTQWVNILIERVLWVIAVVYLSRAITKIPQTAQGID